LSGLAFFLMINYYLYALVWVALVFPFYSCFRYKKFVYVSLTGILTAFFIFLSFYWLTHYNTSLYWKFSLFVTFVGFVIGSLSYLVLQQRFFVRHGYLYFPLVWLVLGVLFSFYMFGNSWMLFGYFQPAMYPLGYVLGPLLYSVFIIFINAFIAWYFYSFDATILKVLIVCILVILGSFVYSHVAQPQGEEVNVLLVQGYVKNSWLNRIGISDLLLFFGRNMLFLLIFE
jgi:apolipoprotein N-acyltransferase